MSPYLQISILSFWLLVSCTRGIKPETQAKQYKSPEELFYYKEYPCFHTPHCYSIDMLRLRNRDSLLYISRNGVFGTYEEFHGKPQQINDSLYYVRCIKYLRSEVMEDHGPYQDTLLFICDSVLIGKTLTITYQNKKKERHKIRSTENDLWINRNYFNAKQDLLELNLEYLNPLIDDTVRLRGNYHGATLLAADKYFNDFYLVLDCARARTLNLFSHQEFTYGPKFGLERLPAGRKLSQGYRLRGQKNG